MHCSNGSEDLVCFSEGVKTLGIPLFDEKGNQLHGKYDTRYNVGSDEYIEILCDIQEELSVNKKIPLFEAQLPYFKSICSLSVIDSGYDLLMVWETMCNEYSIWPYSGGLFEQPNKLVESFMAIMVARNEYYTLREHKMRTKINQDQRNSDRRSSMKGMRL